MALPERVTKVHADNRVMFHWAEHAVQKQNNLRGDTATYQWVGKSARAVVSNPYALLAGDKDRTYQIIGRVEPSSPLYPTIQYLGSSAEVRSQHPSALWYSGDLAGYLHSALTGFDQALFEKSGDCVHLTWRCTRTRRTRPRR